MKKISLIPDSVAGQVSKWIDQCTEYGKYEDPELWPSPSGLGAISEYASAIVMGDGIVLTNGPEYSRRIIPDWAYQGWRQAYDTIEDILCYLQKVDSDSWYKTPQNLREVEEKINNIPSYSPFDIFDKPFARSIRSVNYIAWQIYAASCSYGILDKTYNNLTSVDTVCDTGYLLTRCIIESNRPKIKDGIERPFASVAMEMGEIQLPLVLAVALSRIDKPQHFLDELQNMKQEFNYFRKTMQKIEKIISSPTERNSGKKIRLLRKDLEDAIKKASGGFQCSPSPIETVGGLLSLDPLSCVGEFLSKGLYKPIVNLFRKPATRLLTKWTEDCAFNTVSKLRKVFKTNGSDEEWLLVARALQQHGSVAWYPIQNLNAEN